MLTHPISPAPPSAPQAGMKPLAQDFEAQPGAPCGSFALLAAPNSALSAPYEKKASCKVSTFSAEGVCMGGSGMCRDRCIETSVQLRAHPRAAALPYVFVDKWSGRQSTVTPGCGQGPPPSNERLWGGDQKIRTDAKGKDSLGDEAIPRPWTKQRPLDRGQDQESTPLSSSLLFAKTLFAEGKGADRDTAVCRGEDQAGDENVGSSAR